MKLCVDCKHFSGLNFCNHPNNGISPVDGRPKPVFATVNRGSSGECGEQGEWYEEEPAIKPTSWWEMFWSKNK